MGGSTPCALTPNISTTARKQLKLDILLTSSTVASIVLLYHVLNRLHSQYAFVHFGLLFREGAEYDFVIFFGELILDDILRPECCSVHP
jgi:hypothetical protein